MVKPAPTRRKMLTQQQVNALVEGSIVAAPYAASAARSVSSGLADFYAKRMEKKKAPGVPRRVGASSNSSTISAPVSQGYMMSGFGGASMSQVGTTSKGTRLSGQTFLGQVVTSATTNNQIVGAFNTLPTLFTDRVGIVAGTYDKYVYRNVRAVYTPICSTATAGSVIMYFDRDVMDAPADPAKIGEVMSAENACLGPVWAKQETRLSRDTEEKRTYFTSVGSTIEPHELVQFKLYVYSVASAASTTLGIVTLHYDMELIAPVYAPREVSQVNIANAQFQFSLGTVNVQLAAGTNATISGTTFGQPTTFFTRNPVWEIVVADANGGTITAGIAAGTGGLQATSRSGTVLYLTTNAGNAALAAGLTAFTLYTTYQGALTRGTNHLHNGTGGNLNVFTANARLLFRAIGSASLDATM